MLIGANASQYDGNLAYEYAAISAVVSCFTNPTVNASQVANGTVFPVSSNSAVVSYRIMFHSVYPVSAYTSQLVSAVSSGAFDTYLQTAARIYHASGFYSGTSGPVTIGRERRYNFPQTIC